MAMSDDQGRLGCGRSIDDVWATADRPPDAHEQDCPYCQEARASLTELSEATDSLLDHEDETPDFTPGAHVKDLVMQLVHVEVRRSQPLPLLVADPAELPATLTISRQAVLDVIWRTADSLPGVRARHCAVEVDPQDQQPGHTAVVDVRLDIAMAAGLAVPDLTASLRAQLRERLTAETGLTTRRIDVTVEDLYDA